MKGSKITSLLLTCAMLLSLVVIPASAAEGDLLISPNPTAQETAFPDVADHWGKGSVERWAGYGVLKGDETGAFNPDKQMTRAEFATMLVNLMGYTEKAENSFADVKDGDWYADAILKLAAAGIMKGDGVNANPNAPISREETVVLLCRAMNIQPSPNASVNFADKDQVASWAQDAVAALSERGMINGMGDNQFAPALEITRASVAKMVDNMVAAYVVDDTQELTGEIKGVVIIAANSDVTIKDATLSENIIVAPKAADATLALTGKTVAKKVILSADSASLSVEKDAAAGDILVEAPKGTVAVAGKADSVMTGEGASAANVSVAKGATVDAVALSGKDAKLDVTGAVKEVQVSSTASNTEVVANSGAKIDKMETSADNVAVSGKGTIKDMTVTAGEGVEVSKDTKVDKIENKGDAPVDVGGKPVEPGKDTSNQGGSSSGGSSGGNTPSVTYKYNVTIGSVTGGTVTTDLSGNHTDTANTEVKLTVTPNQGWKLATLTVTKPGVTAPVDIKSDPKFTMDTVGTYTVNATFVQPLTKFEVKVFGVADDAFKWLTDTMGFNLSREQYNKDFGNINAGNPWLFIAGKRGDGMTKGLDTEKITIKANGAQLTANWGKSAGDTSNIYSLYVQKVGTVDESKLNFDGPAATIEVSVEYEGVTYTASCEYKAPNAGTIYTVSFNSNGGSAVSPQKIEENGKANKPTDPTKTGYTLEGWYKEAGLTTKWDFANDAVTANTTIYAKWTPITSTVTFDYDGATGGNKTQTAQVTYDGTYATLPTPTKTGHTFDGWYTAKEGGTKVEDSTKVTATGAHTLYARWTLNKVGVLTATASTKWIGTEDIANGVTGTVGSIILDPNKELDLSKSVVLTQEMATAQNGEFPVYVTIDLNGKDFTFDTIERKLAFSDGKDSSDTVNYSSEQNTIYGEAGRYAILDNTMYLKFGTSFAEKDANGVWAMRHPGATTTDTITFKKGGEVVAIATYTLATNNISIEKPVAKVGGTFYNDLASAISAVGDSGTVTLLADATVSEETEIKSDVTLEIVKDVTLTVSDTLIVKGVLAVTGDLAGTGTVQLYAKKAHSGTAITNVEFFCVNDETSYNKLPGYYITEYPWKEHPEAVGTMPWIAVTYDRATVTSIAISVQKDQEQAIEGTGTKIEEQKDAFLTINGAENKGLEAGTYTATLTVVQNGLTFKVDSAVEVVGTEAE